MKDIVARRPHLISLFISVTEPYDVVTPVQDIQYYEERREHYDRVFVPQNLVMAVEAFVDSLFTGLLLGWLGCLRLLEIYFADLDFTIWNKNKLLPG